MWCWRWWGKWQCPLSLTLARPTPPLPFPLPAHPFPETSLALCVGLLVVSIIPESPFVIRLSPTYVVLIRAFVLVMANPITNPTTVLPFPLPSLALAFGPLPWVNWPTPPVLEIPILPPFASPLLLSPLLPLPLPLPLPALVRPPHHLPPFPMCLLLTLPYPPPSLQLPLFPPCFGAFGVVGECGPRGTRHGDLL